MKETRKGLFAATGLHVHLDGTCELGNTSVNNAMVVLFVPGCDSLANVFGLDRPRAQLTDLAVLHFRDVGLHEAEGSVFLQEMDVVQKPPHFWSYRSTQILVFGALGDLLVSEFYLNLNKYITKKSFENIAVMRASVIVVVA